MVSQEGYQGYIWKWTNYFGGWQQRWLLPNSYNKKVLQTEKIINFVKTRLSKPNYCDISQMLIFFNVLEKLKKALNRWFVLKGGTLTYYKDANTTDTGCRSSFKLEACNIIVHPIDPLR